MELSIELGTRRDVRNEQENAMEVTSAHSCKHTANTAAAAF